MVGNMNVPSQRWERPGGCTPHTWQVESPGFRPREYPQAEQESLLTNTTGSHACHGVGEHTGCLFEGLGTSPLDRQSMGKGKHPKQLCPLPDQVPPTTHQPIQISHLSRTPLGARGQWLAIPVPSCGSQKAKCVGQLGKSRLAESHMHASFSAAL